MNKMLPSLLIVLGLNCAALPARADDPPATGDDAPQGGSIGGVGIQKGSKDKTPNAARSEGGGGAPSGEGLDGVGKDVDACLGLPPQTRTTVLAQAKLLKGKLLVNNPDAIDLHKVTFVKGVSIADWARVSKIKDVKVGGGNICIDHTYLGSGNWNADFFGDKDVKVEGNQWIFAFIKGRWYGGAGEWIRPAQLCKIVNSANVGCGVFYASEPLKSWRPAHGEMVGVAVSAPARAGQWSKAERSNVVIIPWP